MSSRYATNKPLLPSFMLRDLTYHSSYDRADTATANAITQQFRGNSCFDPDYTGTGHQPLGFDQFMALYASYRVMSFKITVRLASEASVSYDNIPLMLAVWVRPNDTTVFTNGDTCAENAGGCLLVNKFTSPVTYTMEVSCPKLFGITEREYIADDQFQGDAAANPTRWAVVNAAVWNPAGYRTAHLLDVSIQQHVRFEAPLSLASS